MQNEMEKFEDWKGREAIPGRHGGIGAASIDCGNNETQNFFFFLYNNNF